MDEEWIAIGEAARRLGLSEASVRRRCDDGTLRSIWTKPPGGGQRRIAASSVETMRQQMYGGGLTDVPRTEMD